MALPPAPPSSAGWKIKDDSAVEIAGLRKVLGRTKKHRRMPVMPAGMHLARHGRGIVQPRRLFDRQRVHIGPKPDHTLPLVC